MFSQYQYFCSVPSVIWHKVSVQRFIAIRTYKNTVPKLHSTQPIDGSVECRFNVQASKQVEISSSKTATADRRKSGKDERSSAKRLQGYACFVLRTRALRSTTIPFLHSPLCYDKLLKSLSIICRAKRSTGYLMHKKLWQASVSPRRLLWSH